MGSQSSRSSGSNSSQSSRSVQQVNQDALAVLTNSDEFLDYNVTLLQILYKPQSQRGILNYEVDEGRIRGAIVFQTDGKTICEDSLAKINGIRNQCRVGRIERKNYRAGLTWRDLKEEIKIKIEVLNKNNNYNGDVAAEIARAVQR